jgi:DNA adenine methylase
MPDLHQVSKSDLKLRALKPNSSLPRAFLRWAGSKRLILRHIVDLLPERYRVYHEPFLGAGSLFFLIQPERAHISDSCQALIDTFCAVRDNVSAVLRYLTPLRPSQKLFYEIRENGSHSPFKSAAEFIYLNKTCWNGLYRVNANGRFNVPYGRPAGDTTVDPINLRHCSDALGKREIRISASDFAKVLENAEKGDLVYIDPPYVTGHHNNGFRDYNERLFSWEDQERLAQVAKDLVRKGAHVIISSANHPDVVRLYPDFSLHVFDRKSTLASDTTKRRNVSEALFRSNN